MNAGTRGTTTHLAQCGGGRFIHAALLAAILSGLVACGDPIPVAQGTARIDSAGIEIVTSSGPDITRDHLDPSTGYLLDQDGTPYIFARTTPQWVRTTAAGDILVLAADLGAVIRFDTAGWPVGAIGSRGEGPGEFRMPVSLMVNADTLSVFDAFKRAILRWTGNGDTLIPQLTLDTAAAIGTPYALRGTGVLSTRDLQVDGQRFGALSWSTDSAPIIAFPFPPTTLIAMACRDQPLERPPLLSPAFHAATDGALTVAAGTAEYQVWVIRDGRIVRVIRRDVPVRPPTREEVRLAAGRGYTMTLNGRQCSLSPGELVERAGVAAVFPAVHGVAITTTGRVWVMRTFQREFRGTVDEFDSTGEYLRTWRHAPLPLAELPDGRLIVPRDDPDSGGILLQIVRVP